MQNSWKRKVTRARIGTKKHNAAGPAAVQPARTPALQSTNAANCFRGVCRACPSGLPTGLAVGFGLEALPAGGRIHPGRWQAVAHRFPRSSAPRIRLASRHHGWRRGEVYREPYQCQLKSRRQKAESRRQKAQLVIHGKVTGKTKAIGSARLCHSRGVGHFRGRDLRPRHPSSVPSHRRS